MFKALNKTRGLYLRWRELDEGATATPELEWTTTELRNSLRSIEWDLEDLEDTIDILLKVSTHTPRNEDNFSRVRLVYLLRVNN